MTHPGPVLLLLLTLPLPFEGLAASAVASPSAVPAPLPPPSAVGEVIDQVAAVVDGQVITQSELTLEARVHLIQRGGLTAVSGALEQETLRSALELGIAERVEASEAERLQAFVIEPDQIVRAVSEFERLFPNPGAFQAFLTAQESDRSQVAAILTRSLRAERLLDSRVQLRAQVADWEVRQHYDAHPELQSTSYDELRMGLKEKMTRLRYGQLARQELSQMMRSAQVRRVAPFARPPEAGGTR